MNKSINQIAQQASTVILMDADNPQEIMETLTRAIVPLVLSVVAMGGLREEKRTGSIEGDAMEVFNVLGIATKDMLTEALGQPGTVEQIERTMNG